MELIKTIAKYANNILCMASALIVGLGAVYNWGWANTAVDTIAVIIGVIGTYLLGNKWAQDDKKVFLTEDVPVIR
jgi:hypothetical protein